MIEGDGGKGDDWVEWVIVAGFDINALVCLIFVLVSASLPL